MLFVASSTIWNGSVVRFSVSGPIDRISVQFACAYAGSGHLNVSHDERKKTPEVITNIKTANELMSRFIECSYPILQ